MHPNRLPYSDEDQELLDYAAKYAPFVYIDDKEPFSIVAAGYSVLSKEEPSPSFLPHRRVAWTDSGYPAASAIEYALWWDWDIGHLYELEHVWTFVASSGKIVAVEASWHGMYGQLEVEGEPLVEGTHPILFAQPGKHAMAATIEPFFEVREWAEQEAGPDAGKDGILENELFRGQLDKTPENDARVRAYLNGLAFTPSWNFNRGIPVTRDMLVPWQNLKRWIPLRVQWCLQNL